MGAACCRCQQAPFEDVVLRFPPRATATPNRSRRAAHGETSSTSSVALLTWASAAPHRQRAARARRPSRQSVTMNHSLANYVAFPFPFASTTPAKKAPKPKSREGNDKKKKKAMTASSRAAVLEMLPTGLGDHFSKNEKGEATPLSLADLCVRRVCASLVVDPESYSPTWPASRNRSAYIPSEVASALVAYLKRHELLTKEHFRSLARYLYQDWDLRDQLDVDSSWFDDIDAVPLRYIKSIDFSNCANLTSLGSDRWLQVDEMPNLCSASFRDCGNLSNCVPDILQSSTRLTSLNLGGCLNVDDRSLLALRRSFRLKTLDLSECSLVTDEGFNCLTSLSRLEKLVLTRCTGLTDQAFEDVELAFPMLKHLDVAHCRITDIALAHFGHVVSLTTLIIRGCRQVTDSGMDRLASLTALQHFDARHCKEVRSVRAEWCDMRVLLLTGTAFTETEALIVKDMERMSELDLRACKVLKRGAEFISKLVNLKRLTLAETALTDSALIQICKGIRGLVALNVSHTEITDTGTEGFSYLVDLEELRMDTPGISNRSLVNVAALKKLRCLDLFGTSISDNGLLHISGMKDLKVLEICSGAITDRGVELISRLKGLRTLNLSQNRYINAKGVQYLRTLTKLRHLNLSHTGISADSFRHFQALKDLESLSIYGCEITSMQIEMLQELLPKLRCLRCS